MKYLSLFFFYIFMLFTVLEAQTSDFLIGTYYYAGWWSDPPVHFVRDGVDWRLLFPEREPIIGWYDDQQSDIDEEIILAASGGVNFFAFDFYTAHPNNVPGALKNHNNGLKYFVTSPYKKLMNFAMLYVNNNGFEITDITEWNAYVDEWVNYFRDPQYLKINNKPVFIIYIAGKFIDQWGDKIIADNALKILRMKAIEAGFDGVIIGGGTPPGPKGSHIIASSAISFDFFTAYGCDFSNVSKTPHPYSDFLTLLPNTWNAFLTYSKIPYAPITEQGHDSRPWQPDTNFYFYGGTPALFGEQLQLAKNFLIQNPRMNIDGKSMVMINAWNEIADGGELIPTVSAGYSYLDQVRQVFYERFARPAP